MNLEPLLYFVRERETVRVLKEAGVPPPWTADPIIRTYRFTNIRRRDDRVSRWLRAHVLRPEQLQANPEAFILFTALCRHINWPPTITAIMTAGLWPTTGRLDLSAIGGLIDARTVSRQKAWTGAYMVRAEPSDKGGKGLFVTEKVIGGLALTRLLIILGVSSSRERVWNLLRGCWGWGSFMAGQVVDDWTWTPLLDHASDIYTWAPQGPGSARGFNRLVERPLNTRVSAVEWAAAIPVWRQVVADNLTSYLGPTYDSLTAMDLQNCLCETDKYLRVKNGEGRPRALYRTETAY